MPEKIEELVRAALRPRRPATFPHLNLTIALSSDRLTLLMASGPLPWP